MTASPTRLSVLLLAALVASSACAQDAPEPSAEAAPSPECSVETDLTCAVRGLEPQDAVHLAGGLFLRHEAGEFDLERLTRTSLPMLMEIAPPLLLSGTLRGIEEAAPEVVARHRAAVPEPTTPAERAGYVRALLDAFAASDVDLSGWEVTEPPDEYIQIIEIPRSGDLE